MSKVILNGKNLTIDQLVAVTRDFVEVEIAPECRADIIKVSQWIEENWMNSEAPPIYGFTTGLGKLKDSRIDTVQSEIFQLNVIKSHSGQVGEPLPEEVVRAAMLVRVINPAIEYIC